MNKSSKWMLSAGLSVLFSMGGAFAIGDDRGAGQSNERVTIIDLPHGNRTAIVTDRNGTRVVNKIYWCAISRCSPTRPRLNLADWSTFDPLRQRTSGPMTSGANAVAI